MAEPNTDFSDIITTTLRRRSKVLADNLSDNTALLFRLRHTQQIQQFHDTPGNSFDIAGRRLRHFVHGFLRQLPSERRRQRCLRSRNSRSPG